MSEEHNRWRIEVGPILNHASGSDDDAPFEKRDFVGTRAAAEAEASRLSSEYEELHRSSKGTKEYPCFDSDRGMYAVGASIREIE